MKAILQRSEKAVGNPEEFMACDMEFHVAVAEASQNSMYSIMLQVCRNVLGKSLAEILHRGKKSTQKVRYELILDVHGKIYMAVKNQKEEEAVKWMTTHLINAESDILVK